jgi:hypothetical protein
MPEDGLSRKITTKCASLSTHYTHWVGASRVLLVGLDRTGRTREGPGLKPLGYEPHANPRGGWAGLDNPPFAKCCEGWGTRADGGEKQGQ